MNLIDQMIYGCQVPLHTPFLLTCIIGNFPFDTQTPFLYTHQKGTGSDPVRRLFLMEKGGQFVVFTLDEQSYALGLSVVERVQKRRLSVCFLFDSLIKVHHL